MNLLSYHTISSIRLYLFSTSFSLHAYCRWNGASSMDYPGVRRVDHQNETDVRIAIAEVKMDNRR